MSRSRRLEGRVAIVTGSTSGIGLCIARRLAEDGAKVVVSSSNQENVDSAVKTLRKEPGNLTVEGIVCNVGSYEQRQNLVEKTVSMFGQIDILVCGAAINPCLGPVLKATEREWEELFRINTLSVIMMIKEAKPYMTKTGSIVLLSFIGAYGQTPLLGSFAVSKTPLLSLTKMIASEMLPVRINCVANGYIESDTSGRTICTRPEIKEEVTGDAPLVRFGQPEECAGVVSFLCSDDASYMTAETIVMAGGQQSRL